MVLNLELLRTNVKPVFDIKIPGLDEMVKALIDTGSVKTIWCSAQHKLDEDNLKKFQFKDTGETTTLSGFGIGEQKNCKIYKGCFNIYRNGVGIVFRDIEIVESKKQILAFDMILPYPLFRKFRYTFEPATPDAKFGMLKVDTLGNKIIYGLKSAGGVVIDIYTEESNLETSQDSIAERQNKLSSMKIFERC